MANATDNNPQPLLAGDEAATLAGQIAALREALTQLPAQLRAAMNEPARRQASHASADGGRTAAASGASTAGGATPPAPQRSGDNAVLSAVQRGLELLRQIAREQQRIRAALEQSSQGERQDIYLGVVGP